jgi:hypothetical protein
VFCSPTHQNIIEGKKCYRLCRVAVVKGEKSYNFPPANPQEKPAKLVFADSFETTLMHFLTPCASIRSTPTSCLFLKFGTNEKEFPMYLISDTRPSQDDVNKYVNVVKSARAEVLSKRAAAKLRRKQDELVNNYTYTKEDIERNLQERETTGKTANLSLEQTRAELAVQGAR